MLKELIKDMSENFDLNKKYPGYFKKIYFRLAPLLCLVLLGIVFFTNGNTLQFIYVECENSVPCENLFRTCVSSFDTNCINHPVPDTIKALCDGDCKRYLAPDEVLGNKPNVLAEHYNVFCLFIVFFAFAFNHIHYKISKRRY